MSGNRNCATYCDFGSNRTSNVRVNQGPGGNSTFSLGWATNDDAPIKNQRPSNVINQHDSSYGVTQQQQRSANNYSNQLHQQQQYQQPVVATNYHQMPLLPPTGYPYESDIRQAPYQDNNNRGNNQGYNDYAQKRQQPSYQDAYNKYQEENAQQQSRGGRQQQQEQPQQQQHSQVQGRSSFQIGGDYNNFEKKNQIGRNDFNKVGGQQVNDYSYNQSATNNGGRMNNSNPISSENMPRQPNNLHDVKFGYRVNQPPGGHSNIVFG